MNSLHMLYTIRSGIRREQKQMFHLHVIGSRSMLAEKKTIDRFLFESDIIVDEAFSKLNSAINNYEL